ncbi:VTT domain-containing protein [Candidatus Micrarchaeota archaeon]|nr:VTT domain-containing protein [Candidatus Micrarchaeota archaeon]
MIRMNGRKNPGELEKKKPYAEIAIAFLAGAMVLVLSDRIGEFAEFGYFGAFAISLLGSATILVPVPGWAVVAALSKTLDPLLLGVLAGMGSAIGEMTAYLFGNGVAQLLLEKRKKDFEKYREMMRENDFWAIFVLSFLPNPLFDIAGLAAGASKVHWARFLLFCALGRVLRFILFGYAGSFILNGI